MIQEFIELHGARENNLKNISLRIPKRKITIFTGVSGSGTSSIVFDTIASEAQRQLYENFSMFVRNFLTQSGLFDNDKKLEVYTEEEMERLLYSPPFKVKTNFGGKTVNLTMARHLGLAPASQSGSLWIVLRTSISTKRCLDTSAAND